MEMLNGYLERALQPVRPPTVVDAVDDTRFAFFPGAHIPGAMMLLITTSDDEQILYPGDYCLRNAYYHQTPSNLLNLFSHTARRKWILIDGAFLGHEPAASTLSNLAEAKERIAEEHQKGKSVVMTAEHPDYLYPAYIWLFRTFYAGHHVGRGRHLLVDQAVLRMLNSTFDPFIRRQHERFDPFFNAVMGKQMSSYLESVRIYPLSENRFPETVPAPYDVVCSIPLLPLAMKHLPIDSLILTIGRQRGMLSACFDSMEPHKPNRLVLDGPDFTFHSSSADIVELVKAAINSGVTPIVFHNFRNRIRKALDRAGIPTHHYHCVGSHPVRLDE
jgi:hypothetical protein